MLLEKFKGKKKKSMTKLVNTTLGKIITTYNYNQHATSKT